MNEPVRLEEAEIRPLAAKLAKEFEGFIKFYQDVYELSREDAEEKARFSVRERAVIMNRPPDQVTWMCLGQLAEKAPEDAAALWTKILDDARDEIDSGHRAAKVISAGFDFGPLDRARFLEVRAALREEWNPSVGSESTLIDMLAQIQTAWESWLGRHMLQISLESCTSEERVAKRGGWLPERVNEAESIQLSAAMVDRFNRLYLRTLRSLRDLRRMTPNITVQNGGQVNVGSQQVNVAAVEPSDV